LRTGKTAPQPPQTRRPGLPKRRSEWFEEVQLGSVARQIPHWNAAKISGTGSVMTRFSSGLSVEFEQHRQTGKQIRRCKWTCQWWGGVRDQGQGSGALHKKSLTGFWTSPMRIRRSRMCLTAMYNQPKQFLRILHIFVGYLAIGDCPFQIGLRGRSRLFGQKPDQGSGVTGQTLVPDPSPDQFTTDRSTSSSFCRLSLRKKVLP